MYVYIVSKILYNIIGDNMKQICKLKGYENISEVYYITRDGNVYNNKRKKNLHLCEKTGGYLYACLIGKDDKGIYKKKIYSRVHRIVATAYCKNKANKPYVNHIDENRQNNHYKNLEWVTPTENNMWSLAKKIYCYKNNKLIKEYNSCKEVELDGFNKGHATAVARGVEKQHKGFIFSYHKL